MKTYLIGHIKPDLDSVVAALVFAKYCQTFGHPNLTPAMIDDPNPETTFIFSKFNLNLPTKITLADITPEDKVILVDHNEADQRLPGLNPDQIVAIFDHHKANLNLTNPIEISILPFGSSCTVAFQLMSEIKLDIDQDTARLMLCAILSDTVGLKSATTTDVDRGAVTALSQIAGITDIAALTLEIFKAKSNISSLTPEQIVTNDYKVFDFKEKVLIAQIETVDQETLLSTRKVELLQALSQVKAQQGVSLIFLAVSDILKVNTKLLLVGDREVELAQKAFNSTAADGVLDIGPKLSRKKEIAPAIEIALNQF